MIFFGVGLCDVGDDVLNVEWKVMVKELVVMCWYVKELEIEWEVSEEWVA